MGTDFRVPKSSYRSQKRSVFLPASPELAIALLNLRTDSYGTLRKKEGLPKNFWNWKPMKGDPPKKASVMILWCYNETMKARQNQQNL